MKTIDTETGEVFFEYPYLDEQGRLICDPKPLVVPVQLTQIGMNEYRIPTTLVEGSDIDGDGDFDIIEDDDVMPFTQYELEATGIKIRPAVPEEAPKEPQTLEVEKATPTE